MLHCIGYKECLRFEVSQYTLCCTLHTYFGFKVHKMLETLLAIIL